MYIVPHFYFAAKGQCIFARWGQRRLPSGVNLARLFQEENLVCGPAEKDGRFLLNEIMVAGNFGQSDPRMAGLNTSSQGNRRISQAWRRFKRNLRFVRSYPEEVFWEPVVRMEHFAWKKLKWWRF